MEQVGLRSEFLTFLETYNIFGVAIGLLVATKVGSLTSSLIEDFVTPLMFKPLFTKLKINKLQDLSYKGILYGEVVAKCIDFIVTAFIVFLAIKYLDITLKK